MRRCVWLALACMAGIVGSGAGQAASFDCRKASKPMEIAICGDAALSAADEKLARDYNALLERLPPALKAALQKSQRSWLAYAPLACSNDGRGTVKDKAAFTQCLKTEYDMRLSLLAKQPRAIGPFKTVTLAEYQAMPSSSNDPEFFPVVTHTKSVMTVFDGDERQAALLNAWLQSLANADQAGWNDPDKSASFDVSLSAVNAIVATATLSSDMFGVGAAHPLAGSISRHLLLASGKPLTWRDMFQSNARDRLTNMVWTALKKKLDGDMMIEKKSDLAKLVEDPGHWTFAPDGLTINFNVYEVAAYAMGPQDITLPWPSIRDLLTPLGQEIAASR